MTNGTEMTDHAVAIFRSSVQVESAIRSLCDAGHDIKNLSVVSQDYATEEHPIGFSIAAGRMLSWGKQGMFWGSVWGCLDGCAMAFIPGVGYVLFAGWVVAALESAVLGGTVAALYGALVGIGIPRESALEYESAVKAGRFLVLVHGDEKSVKQARGLLAATTATRIDGHTNRVFVNACATTV